MTHLTAAGGLRVLGFVLLAGAMSFLSGCKVPGCPLGCGTSSLLVQVPNSTFDQLASIETDGPCTAFAARDRFSVTFRSVTDGCCGTQLLPVDASVPELIDGSPSDAAAGG
jgi:hypothetical protein